jgi:coproporphyrinogen III oxidase
MRPVPMLLVQLNIWKETPYGERARNIQRICLGRNTEYKLVYDRGAVSGPREWLLRPT